MGIIILIFATLYCVDLSNINVTNGSDIVLICFVWFE